MHPVQNADGGSVLQTARNYPIDAATVIDAGAVVKLSGGKVVLAAAAENGGILGIAAEFHSGTEDALNLRANGTQILVCDNPTLIFECAAPTIKAASGSATTLVPATGDVDASAADDAFNNAVLVLREKAASSTNTDALGTQIVVYRLRQDRHGDDQGQRRRAWRGRRVRGLPRDRRCHRRRCESRRQAPRHHAQDRGRDEAALHRPRLRARHH